MSKDVFISYSTPNKYVAEKVVSYFEARGVSCYIAPRDVDPGVSYASNLTRAIETCKAVVLIASSAINNSEHVLNEIDIIVSAKKFFVPFFIEDFAMNNDFRYYLGRHQRIIAHDEPEAHFGTLFEAIGEVLPKTHKQIVNDHVEISSEAVENTKKVFDYIPARGIMINPEDQQRNVSFRTDTFINLLGGIYDEMVKLTDESKVLNIFHDTGYNSGQSFAQRINSRWDLETQSVSLYAEKLKKWCEFDSAVGWGKFDIDVNVNEETGDFSGRLTISECFIVDMKNHRPLCEFVKGYSEGVIETLLGVKVKLICVTCPMKNRFKAACVFDVILEED